MSVDVEIIKNELASYELYKKYLDYLEELRDNVEYDLSNVKAVQYDKIGGNNANEHAIAMKQHQMRDMLESIDIEITITQYKINWIDRLLDCVEGKEKEIMLDIVAKTKYQDMTQKYGLTSTGSMAKLINEIIEKTNKKKRGF